MTCEDEVSYQAYSFFSKSRVQVLSWHPPNGKKYFTRHLRIPRFSGSVRRGRSIIDLILLNRNQLLLIECKCKLSESYEDITKLRSIRDEIGLENLKATFIRQGAPTQDADSLLLGIGVRYLDASIPKDFLVFEVKSGLELSVICGSDIDKAAVRSLIETCRTA